MVDLAMAITSAIDYSRKNGIDIPIDLLREAHRVGALKKAGSFTAASKVYSDQITNALLNFFENIARLTSVRSSILQSMVEAFGSVFDLGWIDGGGTLPADIDARDWFNAKVDAEIGHIRLLMEQAKELKKDKEFDFVGWVQDRAIGYSNTLRDVYNNASLRAMKDQMVTFEGDDGAESCKDCVRLKGKRHKISWFIARDVVPPYGHGLECHAGGHCQHGLMNSKGEWVTI